MTFPSWSAIARGAPAGENDIGRSFLGLKFTLHLSTSDGQLAVPGHEKSFAFLQRRHRLQREARQRDFRVRIIRLRACSIYKALSGGKAEARFHFVLNSASAEGKRALSNGQEIVGSGPISVVLACRVHLSRRSVIWR